jgi:hypothetical protein
MSTSNEITIVITLRMDIAAIDGTAAQSCRKLHAILRSLPEPDDIPDTGVTEDGIRWMVEER